MKDGIMNKLFLILLMTCLATTGCTQRKQGPPTARNLVKIRFGELGISATNLFLDLGVQKGFFAEEGIDLDIKHFNGGGPESITAAAAGEVEMGSAGSPVIVGISKGVPIKIVSSPPIKGNSFVLVRRPEVKGIEELKGKKIGVSSIGGGAHQSLRRIAATKGLSPDQYQVLATGTGGTGYASLQSGKVDAIVTSEPWVTKVEQDGIGKVLANADDYYKNYQHSGIFATTKFIGSNPEAVRGFLKGYRKSAEYAKNHQDELLALAKKELQFDEKLLRTLYAKTIPRWDTTGSVDLKALANTLTILKEVGDLDSRVSLTAEQLVDLRFISQ
jgi:NitT/TauT family transport system substrate-binding protein